jgi:hypothetical protein
MWVAVIVVECSKCGAQRQFDNGWTYDIEEELIQKYGWYLSREGGWFCSLHVDMPKKEDELEALKQEMREFLKSFYHTDSDGNCIVCGHIPGHTKNCKLTRMETLVAE